MYHISPLYPTDDQYKIKNKIQIAIIYYVMSITFCSVSNAKSLFNLNKHLCTF